LRKNLFYTGVNPFSAIINFFRRLFSKKAATPTPAPATPQAPPPPAAPRLNARTFPSVFQAWNPVEGLDEDPNVSLARHDLMWHEPTFFGLEWVGGIGVGESFTAASIIKAHDYVAELFKLNPNLVLLAEIRHVDLPADALPLDHPWWLRDAQGNRVPGWGPYFKIDEDNAEVQRHIVAQAKACIDSGVLDGIMLDVWYETPGRLALLKAIRAAIGDFIIIANVNYNKAPSSAPYLNGIMMECGYPKTANEWESIRSTLVWANSSLRQPSIPCLETWYLNESAELNRMRATTAMALTHSRGFCLFSPFDGVNGGDHVHHWYPFWDKKLGMPVGPLRTRNDGAYERLFQNGTVIYNPPNNNTVKITFPEPRTSAGDGSRAVAHSLPPLDGGIYLR